MSDRAPYSRIYWTVLDDPKFDEVRADMRHFGSWSLLLVVADMAYPVPAFIPPSVPKASLDKLADVGLIDLLPARMYRLRGLKTERERRAEAARRGGKGDPTAPQPGPKREAVASLDETRRDETKTSNAGVGSQERPARVDQASKIRFDRMEQRRLEWFRQTGQWDPEWGPNPEVARGAA